MTRNPLVRAAVTLASPARKIPVAARTVTSGGARAPRAAAGSFPVGRCDTSFPDPGPGTGRDRPGSAFAAIARGRFASGLGGAAAVAAALWLAPAAAFAAGTFYVDGANPSASDSNPGTETRPYLTITAAVNAKAGPGTTILVKPAIYREQVTISRSGATNNPSVIQGVGTGVIVDGSDDYSTTAQWTAVSGDVYLAASVTWSPVQVFVNGQRLTASTSSPSLLPPNTFRFVNSAGLYVNAGGGNPGAQQTFVGHRLYGFRLSTKTYTQVLGFTVTHCEDRQIYLSSGSDNCTIAGNTVTLGGKYGIAVTNTNNVTVDGNVVSDHLDHGIYLGNASGCEVHANESFRNARPNQRAANGIYLTNSTGNKIEGNRLHDNQDTGLHFESSNNNLSLQNRSYHNGDHGYDHLSTSGVVHIGDVAYGNYKDGFSIEGKSLGNTVMDCIAIDNGLTTNEFDLWVDSGSNTNFAGDYNIFWNSTSQAPVKFITTQYTTVAAYSQATGQDTHSIQANPLFVDPANADFHLQGGSPAIDCANSSIADWPATDAEGGIRRDDPSTANTGVGPVPYADRGALEFLPGDRAPVVTAPSTVTAGETQVVTINVTAADPDGQGITSLTANLSGLPAGNGAVFVANASNTAGTLTWTPTYADGRLAPYIVSFTATNSLSATASTAVTITNLDRAPIVTAPTTKSGSENGPISFSVSASDPDGEAITSFVADVSGLPAGSNAVFTPNSNKTSGTLAWTPTYNDSGGPYPVTFIASNALSGRATTFITVRNVDRGPVVTAPATQTIAENSPLTFTVTAADPDGDPIGSLSASGLPPGASFTPAAGNASGTVSWTPTFTDAGSYNVTFTATNLLASSSLTSITVTNVDRPPVVVAPASAGATEGQPLTLGVTASDPDGQTILALSASGLPPGATFVPNASNTAGTLSWTPGFDAAPGPYSVTFTATNSLAGSATTSVAVGNVDRAPVVSAPAAAAAAEGQPFTLSVSAVDPDGDAIASFTADLSGLPGGTASFTTDGALTHGTLTWTPPAGSYGGGSYSVTFQAGNALASSPVTTSISVDRAPVVSAPATQSAAENVTLSFTVTAADPDGQPITSLSASGLPGGATFTSGAGNLSGTFTWTPGFDAAPGPYAVAFTAANAFSGTATTSIAVANVDRAPVVTAPATVPIEDGKTVTVTVTASDPDGDPISGLAADLSALPPGNHASFVTDASNTSGTLTWTPRTGDAAGAPYPVTFTAGNALSGSATTRLSSDRSPVATAPVSQAATENVPLTFTVTASDPDGQPITSLAASGLPSGATFTPDSGNLSGTFAWTPGFDAAPGPYTVTFTAANTRSGSATTSISVANVDRPPAVTAPETQLAAVGSAVSFTVTASDPDLDAIASLAAAGLPPGATFTSNAAHTSGTFSWTPPSGSAAGPYSVTFTAQNALGGGAITNLTVDRPPAVAAPAAQTVAEGAPLSFTVTAGDPDGQAITSLAASGLPPGATFTPNGSNSSGTFAWTPGFDAAPGPYAVTFTAANTLSGSASTSVSVANVDRAPVVTAAATAAVNETQPLTLVVNVSDPDGDAINSLSVDLTSLPAGNNAVFTTNAAKTQGTLTWTPTSNDGRAAPYAVTFAAANALSASAATSITVIDAVTNLCPNPSFETNSANWSAYGSATFTRVAGGQDGAFALQIQGPNSTAAFGANDSPNFVSSTSAGARYRYSAWVRSVASTGKVQLRVREYTSGGSQVGTTALSSRVTLSPSWQLAAFDYVAIGSGNTLDLQVLDNVPAAAAETFLLDNVTVAVVTSNPPVVTAPALASVAESSTLTLNVTASDPDGDPIASLTASTAGLPAGNNAAFVVNASNTAGTFTWTPTFSDGPGPYTLTFTSSNSLSGSASTSITVNNVDRAPAVTAPASQTVAEGAPLSFTVTAADPDGDAIGSLAAVGLPGGATFTPNASNTAGTLSWTPGYADAGTYSVTFTAQNALAGSAITSITVTNVDRPPAVSAPATAGAFQGQPFTLNVAASDPDGDAIASLGASNLPAGATFTPGGDNLTGTLSWTPAANAPPGPYAVTFTAQNALAGSATTSITVNGVDHAPVVSAPASVAVAENAPLSFTVTAADPDSQTITSLTAANLPAGATFTPNGANTGGTFAWTPGYSDAGSDTVTFTASNTLSGSAVTVITITNTDRAPIVTAPAAASTIVGQQVTVAVTVSDPDGDAITTLAADLTGLPSGNNAVFTPNASRTAGTLTWTPAASDARAAPYTVTFTATNATSGSATTAITVNAVTNLCTNPSFETNLNGWGPNGSSTLARVAGGQDGTFACQVTGPATTGQFGVNDSPNIITSTTAGKRYRYSAWVRSASNAGQAKLKLREYTPSGSQVGSIVYSPTLTLSPSWQSLVADFVASGTSNTLDFQALDTPVASGEVFLVDNVVVSIVAGTDAQPLVPSIAVDEGATLEAPDAPAATTASSGTVLELAAVVMPNPAYTSASLVLALPHSGFARARLYDVRGRLVKILFDKPELAAGVHAFPIDRLDAGGSLPAGLYFYQVVSAAGERTGRFVFMR